MPVAALSSTLHVLDVFGLTQPAVLQGPIRQALTKYGDGLFVEEGTTNLLLNPSVEVGLANVNAITNGAIARATGIAFSGSACVLVTAVAAGNVWGASYSNAVVGAGQTLTGSVWVRPRDRDLNVRVEVRFFDGAAATLRDDVSAGTLCPKGRWTRLAVTTAASPAGTTTANVHIRTTENAQVVGDAFYTDAPQLEQKAYATSYCDGSLATAWDAPGALYTESFEDGTVSGWSGFVAAPTVASSSAQAYVGTRSLLVTATATAQAVVSAPSGTSGRAVVPGRTYTGMLWVRASAVRNVNCDIRWYQVNGAQSATPVSSSSVVAAVVGAWVKVAVTAVAPADAAYGNLGFRGDLTAGDTIHLDAGRLEEGTGSAAYRWTGAEHNSASTRTASALRFAHALPSTTDFTLAVWARIGGRAGATRALLQVDSNTSDNNRTNVYVTSGNAIAGFRESGLSSGVTVVEGDLVFVALTHTAGTLTVYVSKNGGALVSASGARVAAQTAYTHVGLGNIQTATEPLNGVVEQALVLDRALPLSDPAGLDITDLAFGTDETRYASNPAVALLAAAGMARGGVQAATAAGTGAYRTARTVAASIESIVPGGASPDDDVSTHKISVAAGSGIGEGQVLAFSNPDAGPGTPIYRVQRAFSTGGALDELHVSRVA